MRILQLIQRPQLRGAETFAVQISQHHLRAGHDVLIMALFEHDGALTLETGEVPIESLSLNERNRLFDLGGYRKLAQRIRVFQPDIVQANAGDTLKYAVSSRLIFGWPGQLIFRNANNISSFIRSKIQRAYLYAIIRNVDSVVSVSENCRLDLIQLFPFLTARTETITIGTPLRRNTSVIADDEGIRKNLKVPLNDPILINIGSFVPEKNHLGLLRIFSLVRQQTGIGHLIIVGDGKLRPQIEEKIQDLGLASHVSLLGYRNDVPSILNQSDIMVMPSYIEGMPGVILEAMAHEVVVVASNVGGIGEVVKDNKTGRLISADDDRQFASAVVDLIEKPQEREKLAGRALDYVRHNKSIEKIAELFLSSYSNQLNTTMHD